MSDCTKKSCGHALAGLFIGAGVLGAGYFAANAFKDVKLSSQMLTVKGFAETDVISDYAKWTGNIMERASSRQEVYSRMMATKVKVVTYLQSQNVNISDISYGQANIYASYKMNDKGISTGEVDYYKGSLSVRFESNDVSRVTKIAKGSEKLIQDGYNFESYPPQYLFSKLDNLKIELLGKAAFDAKARAVELSSKVGGKIGALRKAQQGVFQITSRNDTSTSGYGMYDTSSVNKTVKAVVTMSFSVGN